LALQVDVFIYVFGSEVGRGRGRFGRKDWRPTRFFRLLLGEVRGSKGVFGIDVEFVGGKVGERRGDLRVVTGWYSGVRVFFSA
jgi:hypothetical protein